MKTIENIHCCSNFNRKQFFVCSSTQIINQSNGHWFQRLKAHKSTILVHVRSGHAHVIQINRYDKNYRDYNNGSRAILSNRLNLVANRHIAKRKNHLKTTRREIRRLRKKYILLLTIQIDAHTRFSSKHGLVTFNEKNLSSYKFLAVCNIFRERAYAYLYRNC